MCAHTYIICIATLETKPVHPFSVTPIRVTYKWLSVRRCGRLSRDENKAGYCFLPPVNAPKEDETIPMMRGEKNGNASHQRKG